MSRLVKLLLLGFASTAVLAPGALAFRFTDGSRIPPTGTVGSPYSHAIETVGGCKGVKLEVDSGALPPGLRLVGDVREDVDGSNWRIAGTPTAAGDFSFWLRATNLCPRDSTEEPMTIRIAPDRRPPLAIQQATLAVATVGTPYTNRLTAAGGGSQRWSVAVGALPPGMALAADGTLGGAPTADGTFTFTVRVVDGTRTASRQLTLTVRRQLSATAAAVPPAEVGVGTRIAASAAGGLAPYRWEVVGALPTGLALDPATGALAGTPIIAGTYPIVLQVSDAEGRTARAALRLRVNRRLRLVRWPLTPMKRGRAAVRRMFVTGGVPKRRWKIIAGRLPLGVRMNTANGKLIGRPRRAGRFAITVRVNDGYGVVAKRRFVLRVRR
jgi:large repetitive protein